VRIQVKFYDAKIFIPIIVLFLSAPHFVEAQNVQKKDNGSFHLYFENDTFMSTDRGFTHGFRFSWYSNDKYNKRPGYQNYISLSIGQNIYTPDNLKQTQLDELDRPYAGYLYFGIGIHRRNSNWMDTFEFDLGIIGPHSYAEQVQKATHYILNNQVPSGWDNQLKDEIAVQMIYEHKVKLYEAGWSEGLGFEIVPHFGGGLGNVYIYANAGYQIRLGWKLPDDFGMGPFRPGGDCNINARSRGGLGAHIFFALDGQAVARNIFLDGNTFLDSHSVEKKPLTANILTGLSLIAGDFNFSFTYVVWTKKFTTEKRNNSFAALNLSYVY
jgi:lipid A 3-O-deacylase